MKKKHLSLTITAVLCIMLSVAAHAQQSRPYIDENGAAQNSPATTTDYTGGDLTAGWYFVTGTVTTTGRIEVTGDVKIILADGCHLDASVGGIRVEGAANSLTIYAQTANTGQLTAVGDGLSPGYRHSGIGGNFIGMGTGGAGGNISIYGGNITATGSANSAGIGGGGSGSGDGGAGGIITIGGNAVVTATGSDESAGIGGGGSGMGDGGTGGIIIIGGNAVVTAVGGAAAAGGAGIGGGGAAAGGNGGASGTITINTTGAVTATGAAGGVNKGADIGAGSDNFSSGAEAAGLRITSHPSPQTVTEGDGASFGITATTIPPGSGLGITYRWQFSTDGGATWSDVAGATASTLTLTGVTLAMSGNLYRCIASDVFTYSSQVALLTVNPLPTYPPVITGPSAMTLTEGYAATSSGTFTVTGTPAPTVTKTSGDAAITWNSITHQLDIAAGLTPGVYNVTLEAANGIGTNATCPFILTVAATYPLTVSAGQGGIVSSAGGSYAAGTPVSITATPDAGYGFSHWTVGGGATLAGGNSANPAVFNMPAGAVTLTATFTPLPLYSVNISASGGGRVNADRMSSYPGETVTLTIAPNAGYVLLSLRVHYNNGRDAVATQGTGNTRTFTMPAANVTVTAYFINPTYQAAWEAAKAIIEAADFSILQKEANTQAELRYRLAEMINEMLKNNSAFCILHSPFTVSPSDVVVFDYNFRPAQAGTPDNPQGVDGYFEFRVTPPETRSSAYNDGVIIATSYDDVANEQLTMNNEQLRAWTQNGTLYITGLTEGKPLYIYNLYGQRIYTGIADGNEAKIPAPGKGIIIITEAKGSIKTVVP